MFAERESVLEADFLNNYIITRLPGEQLGSHRKLRMESTLKANFLSQVVDSFWHSEKDQLDYFSFYSTGQYFCQRRKQKLNFNTGDTYWETYQFTGATNDQALVLKNQLNDFYLAIEEVKELLIDKQIKEIDTEIIFFEQRYIKKKKEKNEMLAASDWRVLPDVVDSYPGEKDMWIKWRAYLRDMVLRSPAEFENNLQFFKYTCDIKFPIDPKNYRVTYPDGLLEDGTPAPEYMDVNDPKQWGSYDVEVSNDFIQKRMDSIYNLAGTYKLSYRKVNQSLLEIMRILKVEDIVPVDWSKYYVDDSELADKE